mgnify:CR=1 FL=1
MLSLERAEVESVAVPAPALSALFEQMLLVRVLEEELEKLSNTGEVSDLHLNRGQEAIAIGVCAALRPSDYIVVHHRTIAHAVAKGIPLYPLVAEILGKADGVCGGMSGEMHLSWPAVRFMFSFQLVGTAVPIAAGVAWASKYVKKADDIVVVFHGDAATSNAQWHEGLGLAKIQKVPLLLICENNHLAGNIRPDRYMPVGSVAERAAGYGVRAAQVDGNRLDEVLAAATAAAEYVRRESVPFLLECDTTRFSWHKLGQRDTRRPEEMAELYKRDPVPHTAALLGYGPEKQAAVLAAATATVLAVVARARAAAPPAAPRAV